MMNQATIGTILQTIFQLPKGYIVPKQGNWYNPQDLNNSGTFIAYLIRNGKPMAYPSWMEDGSANPIQFIPMKGTLELQIVGPDAEKLADSISLWAIRPDINKLFDDNFAQIMYSDFGAYEVSNFAQQGLNNILAYNLQLPLQWANMIQTGSTLVDTVTGEAGLITVN